MKGKKMPYASSIAHLRLQNEYDKDERERKSAERIHKEKLELGLYEETLKHYERQREILLNNLEEAKKNNDKNTEFKMELNLKFNKQNMDTTLAILANAGRQK